MATYEQIKSNIQTYIEVSPDGTVCNVNILDASYQTVSSENTLVEGPMAVGYEVLPAVSIFEALVNKIDELERRIETLEQVK